MGTIGMSLKEGMTTTDPGEAYTKDLVMKQARQVILLADSSKAGKVSFARAGGLERVHAIITDKNVDRDFARELNKKGIKLVRA
jgi:DeoR/GlpR family transcriptional regulator of sugar metabolism